jgi:hypothetical protein
MRYWPILMSLAFIVITLLVFYYAIEQVYYAVDKCQALGCPQNTKYIGFSDNNQSFYYDCSCYYAQQIKKENVICFKNDTEAISQGRTRNGCGLFNRK